MRWVVPFNDLRPALERQHGELLEATRRVITSGHFILGPEVEKFEGWLRQRTGRKHAIGVANGTDAIELALRVCRHGLTSDMKYVLTVANSAPATVAAIQRAGLRPRYVEVRPDGQMSLDALDHADWCGVCAVLPVHLHGLAPDMYAIWRAARARGVPVVEDAAQAFGSHSVGWSDIACFSFYPTKTLGALGDGGAIITDHQAYADMIRAVRFYGMRDADRPELRQSFEGVNSRLDEMQAAILMTRARRFDADSEERQMLANYYFYRIDRALLPWDAEARKDLSYHLFTIRVREREDVRRRLSDQGVQTAIHYPIPAHEQKPSYSLEELPETEAFCRETLSLPLWLGMSKKDQDWVLKALKEAVQ